jgi:hypothetical protein
MSAVEERKEEFRQDVIEIEEDNDGEENVQERQYDITRICARLKRLLNDCSVAGITLNPEKGRPKSDRVCVLSRFSDEVLKGLWEIIYPNHDKLETEEHKTKGVSACWIWKLRPGFASLENGYPVLSYRKSLSKGTKLPYLKVHQLAAFIGHGKRCGLGRGSATMRAPPGARKRVWLLVASHLCSLWPVHLQRFHSWWESLPALVQGVMFCICIEAATVYSIFCTCNSFSIHAALVVHIYVSFYLSG